MSDDRQSPAEASGLESRRPASTRGDAEPPSSQSVTGLELPLLSAMWPLALAALVALGVGRAFAPALAGAGVGLGGLVHYTALAGAIISQVFAFAAMLLAIVAVFAAARSRLPIAARLGAITLGGFAILPTAWAVHQAVPELSAALVGGSAALLTLLAAPAALRSPYARGPALVVVLVAAAGLVRLVGVGLAFQAAMQGGARLAPFSRALATAAFLGDALAVATAIGWIGSRSRRLTSPASVAILAFALVCTRQALAGRDDFRPIDVLLWRMAVRLTSRPDPAIPIAFQIFVAFLAPLVAGWALFARGAAGPLGAAVALALCAHGAMEMPPSALMLIVGGLGLALAAHEGRGLWTTLTASSSEPRT
ncbi:Hypothetical protein A7982_03468 [Minicystis rosea]|nr:Hypothetical protein A7982_03468 [Minicystis rosea]